ncbi:MetQ/NlpA family ABC transporter substrate-binding protein [Roseateles sp. DAIF2]|uniref:MetQ/NlpA family ABC transporter substrate-binding protein n=1 Tax=Roseateles sp. DAIF2 TaxID=2714952 RepID=UPI0018A31624|nr:MetQ/NlpA family ABC transporter substrate-binding protein [Roseateles sp. DAIF2]QPF76843.1 MetQ/NlpA family ABC transporter substrate-binding protein [Roseateles sp. DAIF2]
MKKRQLLLTAALTLAFAAASAQDHTIKIAVTNGPHAQIAEVAKKVAAEREGLKLQIVEFADYIQPNAALDAGDVQANSYQHLPFLQSQIQARGYKISPVGYTVTAPLGFYSKKFKSLAELPKGARIGIQNDPSNSGRALNLLAKNGLIKLKPTAGISASLADIAENPRGLQIIPVEAAQLPRTLDDLDASAINTNFAVQAGLVPTRDAIAIEESRANPYANLLAVRSADKDQAWVPKLLRAFQSPEVRAFVEGQLKGSLIPAF